MTDKERAGKIYRILRKHYPEAKCSLVNIDPTQFLFSNILSPQTTDVTVNRVVMEIWKKYGDAESLMNAKLTDLEKIVKPAGMYRMKSKRIKASARILMEEFGGVLPGELENLRKFPGIARKTSLVILTEVFNKIEGIIIDTHNIRIAQRLGLTTNKGADAIEKDLMKLLPRTAWKMWSHTMVFHGRALCTARKPRCADCPVRKLCEYGKQEELRVEPAGE
jgi:endonuclease-3